MDYALWKTNWAETQHNFKEWWARKGLVVGTWGAPAFSSSRIASTGNPIPKSPIIEENYRDVEWHAQESLRYLARGTFELDCMPMASSDIGPGSLALALGCVPHFSPETVWFAPCIPKDADLDSLPPITFNPDAPWWQVHEAQLRRDVELGERNYMAACPDLAENIDILSAMRDPQTLMFDMIENPDWVLRSVNEINQAFFEGYSRIYDIIKNPDGSSCFGAFTVWGPGKTVKVQCDACAMFSPEMFRDFVKPALAEQCDWLDNSLYHLDGTQCLCHVDHLLSIPSLDAIEWTPQAGIEPGCHERWFPLYERILDGGKSVQIMSVTVETMEPILKAIGSKGVYLMCGFRNLDELRQAARIADKWRT